MSNGERPIDRHEINRTSNFRSISKINKWRDAWLACYRIVEEFTTVDIKQFHSIFERWVPILNWVFDRPIHPLDRYDAEFYYCNQPNGPNEIIKLYFDDDPKEEIDSIPVYVVFNVYEFQIIQKRYCLDYTKSNQMVFNEARGTVNLRAALENERYNPAEYFQTMTCWHLLFIYTLHALAHWDTYNKYDNGHYDTHLYVRDSPFFKFHFYGQIVYRK